MGKYAIFVDSSPQENCIEPDSEQAIKWGFTSDKFEGYLWRKNKEVYVSLIISKQENKGNMKRMFQNIEKEGLKIAVPVPSYRMKQILTKWGYQETLEHDPILNETIDVWRKI